mmetsp:Transcript_13794/g.21843  ORF Transcript_13794/g.21843 Transcript_13794/m.21843 type:complete len:122 (-) Transcript_13794:1838-2203(-)
MIVGIHIVTLECHSHIHAIVHERAAPPSHLRDACHKSGEEGNKENGAGERNCPQWEGWRKYVSSMVGLQKHHARFLGALLSTHPRIVLPFLRFCESSWLVAARFDGVVDIFELDSGETVDD